MMDSCRALPVFTTATPPQLMTSPVAVIRPGQNSTSSSSRVTKHSAPCPCFRCSERLQAFGDGFTVCPTDGDDRHLDGVCLQSLFRSTLDTGLVDGYGLLHATVNDFKRATSTLPSVLRTGRLGTLTEGLLPSVVHEMTHDTIGCTGSRSRASARAVSLSW